MSIAPYAELQITTNFSFLRGASHAAELVEQAKALGLSAIGVADRNTLAGVVRAHIAAKEHGLKLLAGARLDLVCGLSLLCYPETRAAYGRLCRLLTAGNMRGAKADCRLLRTDLPAHAEGIGGGTGSGLRVWTRLAGAQACQSSPSMTCSITHRNAAPCRT